MFIFLFQYLLCLGFLDFIGSTNTKPENRIIIVFNAGILDALTNILGIHAFISQAMQLTVYCCLTFQNRFGFLTCLMYALFSGRVIF